MVLLLPGLMLLHLSCVLGSGPGRPDAPWTQSRLRRNLEPPLSLVGEDTLIEDGHLHRPSLIVFLVCCGRAQGAQGPVGGLAQQFYYLDGCSFLNWSALQALGAIFVGSVGSPLIPCPLGSSRPLGSLPWAVQTPKREMIREGSYVEKIIIQ